MEGNGATPPDLVEVAAVRITADRPVPQLCTLVQPITAFATRVHLRSGPFDRRFQARAGRGRLAV